MFREKEDREGGGVSPGTGSVFSKSHEASLDLSERRSKTSKRRDANLGKNVSNLSEYSDNE